MSEAPVCRQSAKSYFWFATDYLVRRCICLSLRLFFIQRMICKNGWMDRGPVRIGEPWGLAAHCVRGRSRSPYSKRNENGVSFATLPSVKYRSSAPRITFGVLFILYDDNSMLIESTLSVVYLLWFISLPLWCTTHSAIVCQGGSAFQWLASRMPCPTMSFIQSVLRFGTDNSFCLYISDLDDVRYISSLTFLKKFRNTEDKVKMK